MLSPEATRESPNRSHAIGNGTLVGVISEDEVILREAQWLRVVDTQTMRCGAVRQGPV